MLKYRKIITRGYCKFAFDTNEEIQGALIHLHAVSISFNSCPILSEIDLDIFNGTKIILTGVNGSGKSTFLKLCNKQLKHTSGTLKFDPRITIGCFDSVLLAKVNSTLSSLKYLTEIFNLDINTAKRYLGQIVFKNMDIIDESLCNLSEGYRARFGLLTLMIVKPHLLLFDEPTNHFDSATIENLIDALSIYMGAIIIASHDQLLLQKMTELKWSHYIIEDGMLECHN